MSFTYGVRAFAREQAMVAKRRAERLEFMPPTAQASHAALTSMQSRGWAIGPDDDLDAIEGHVATLLDACGPLEFGSPESELVSGARDAVSRERIRRNTEHQREVDAQRRRIDHVLKAADLIEDAAQRLGWADAIEDRRAELLPRPAVDAIDPKRMDRAELERVASESDRSAADLTAYAGRMRRAAEVLQMVRATRFTRFAKVAGAIAAEAEGDASLCRARADAARAELADRAERERRERAASVLADVDDVDALMWRVAELEPGAAGGASRRGEQQTD